MNRLMIVACCFQVQGYVHLSFKKNYDFFVVISCEGFTNKTLESVCIPHHTIGRKKLVWNVLYTVLMRQMREFFYDSF